MANTSKRPIRPLGDITLDLEKLFIEMTDQHKLQHGEILALAHIWLTIHAKHAREEYTSGGHPTFYYGPIDN